MTLTFEQKKHNMEQKCYVKMQIIVYVSNVSYYSHCAGHDKTTVIFLLSFFLYHC